MSVRCKLLVERGNYDAPSQDWGDYEFIDLPSPGDRIAAQYEDELHYLTVLCAHHRPIAMACGDRSRELGNPHADIVAKWTGKKEK